MRRMKAIISVSLSLILIFTISVGWAVPSSTPAPSNSQAPTNSARNSMQQPASMELKSRAALLMDAATGTILFEKNSHEKLAPASVTKIMSLLLVMEALDSGRIGYQDMVATSEHAASMGGSQIWLAPGEQMTVHDLLRAVCANSANDCIVSLAEYVSGSEEVFVKNMNLKAQELGMKDTNFMNSHGLDDPNHYTSAHDIAVMSKELLTKHPKITEYTTIWMDSLRDGKTELVNTNRLIRFYKGATGLKTGSTDTAMYCVSATAMRNDLHLISVIMKGPSSDIRFAEAQKLLDYGFANFNIIMMSRKGDEIGEVEVQKGLVGKVTGVTAADVNVLVNKGQEKNVKAEIRLNGQVTAPVTQGQKIGEVVYQLNGNELAKVDVVTSAKVDKASFMNLFMRMVVNWFSLGKA